MGSKFTTTHLHTKMSIVPSNTYLNVSYFFIYYVVHDSNLRFGFHCSDKNIKDFYNSLKELAMERNELLQVIQHREKEHKKLEEELR